MHIKNFFHSKQNPDYVSDHFEKSVPMSTYLVAFVVHDFSYRESVPNLEFGQDVMQSIKLNMQM